VGNRAHPLDARFHLRRLRFLVLSGLALSLAACGDDGITETANGNGEPEPYAHDLAAGASAADFLSAAEFDRLVVEVQYVAGFRPTDAALEEPEAFLNARLNKPAGVEIRLGAALEIPSQATYSAADVRSLEQQHRTVYTEGKTIAAYLLFLDGEYAGGSNVLGIAYNNTSMAVFVERIGDFTGGPVQPSQETVEATVANHEFGHLLGLVNIGSAMQTDHHDEANGPHCDNEDCLMHYSVRLTDFISNLTGGIPSLDQNCIDDLQANGGK
jgi:predicted Zn-dependent protease